MFVMAEFVRALAGVLDMVIQIYIVVVIVAALISWVNPDPYNPIVRFLRAMTEPVFGWVRRILPIPSIGIDISPMIVLLVLIFLQRFLVNILAQIAARMG